MVGENLRFNVEVFGNKYMCIAYYEDHCWYGECWEAGKQPIFCRADSKEELFHKLKNLIHKTRYAERNC